MVCTLYRPQKWRQNAPHVAVKPLACDSWFHFSFEQFDFIPMVDKKTDHRNCWFVDLLKFSHGKYVSKMQKLRSKSGANMVNANLPQIYSPVFELLLRIAKSIFGQIHFLCPVQVNRSQICLHMERVITALNKEYEIEKIKTNTLITWCAFSILGISKTLHQYTVLFPGTLV